MPASNKKWNGTAAMQSVLVLSKTTGAARTLMLAIAAHADSDGLAFPSIRRIARLANISERHAKGILKKLPADEIKIERGGGSGHSNRYRILLGKVNWSSPFVDGEKVKSTALKGEIRDTEKVKSVAEKGESQFTRIDTNQQLEDTGRLVGQPTRLSDFDEHWDSQESWPETLKAKYHDREIDSDLWMFHENCMREGIQSTRPGFEKWASMNSGLEGNHKVVQTGEEANTDEMEWMDNLRAKFPMLDIDGELRRFHDHCRKKGNRANRCGFEGWLKSASPVIRSKEPKIDSEWTW
jgi:hypothetical protein